MKFSAKGRYGIRAMIDLALHDSEHPISAKVIAERQDFSADYLEQIFRLLRKAKLVKSVRAPTGGFVLMKPASRITIWDILEALDEQIKIAPCITKDGCHDDKTCNRSGYCAAHLLWEKVGSKAKILLQETTLEEIVVDARKELATKPMHGHMFHI
jgi:Rrf2 family protein